MPENILNRPITRSRTGKSNHQPRSPVHSPKENIKKTTASLPSTGIETTLKINFYTNRKITKLIKYGNTFLKLCGNKNSNKRVFYLAT